MRGPRSNVLLKTEFEKPPVSALWLNGGFLFDLSEGESQDNI